MNTYDIEETDRVCRAFTLSACQTWDDLRDDPTLGEESITDYQLLRLHRQCPNEVKVIKFSRRTEAQTGADWEWWFGAPGQWFGMRVQAKKLDVQAHEYKHLDYVKRDGIRQVDQLISDASRGNLFPMYVFYNYWDDKSVSVPWRCRTFAPQSRLWGNSVASGDATKRIVDAGIRGAMPVVECSLPITCLTCCRGLAGNHSPTLPERSRGVALHLAESPRIVPSLLDELPPHVQVAQGGQAQELAGAFDIAGILIVQEQARAYE